MKSGLIIVLSLLGGALLAAALIEDPGYVMINLHGYLVEMSVPVLVAGLIAIYLALRLLARIWRAPRKLGQAAAKRRQQNAQRQLERGLALLAEGDWHRGERFLTRASRRASNPLLGYLGAARAAHEQGATERSESWLRLAAESDPDARTVVLLTEAEMQLERGEFADAAATLDKVAPTAATSTRLPQLQAQVFESQKDWKRLSALLPALKRRHAVGDDEYHRLAGIAYRGLFEAPDTDYDRAVELWRTLPKDLRRSEEILATYTQSLVRNEHQHEAEKFIRQHLRKSWSQKLIAIYGRLELPDKAEHLRHAEHWLHDHGEDPVLLIAVARLSMANELWGKARSYLESSLAITPSAEGFALYGNLLEKLGEDQHASEAFRSGLLLASGDDGGRPRLPRAQADKPPG